MDRYQMHAPGSKVSYGSSAKRSISSALENISVGQYIGIGVGRPNTSALSPNYYPPVVVKVIEMRRESSGFFTSTGPMLAVQMANGLIFKLFDEKKLSTYYDPWLDYDFVNEVCFELDAENYPDAKSVRDVHAGYNQETDVYCIYIYSNNAEIQTVMTNYKKNISYTKERRKEIIAKRAAEQKAQAMQSAQSKQQSAADQKIGAELDDLFRSIR